VRPVGGPKTGPDITETGPKTPINGILGLWTRVRKRHEGVLQHAATFLLHVAACLTDVGVNEFWYT